MSIDELLKSKPGFTAALWDRVEAYFEDPQHEAEFREWYRRKYGKEYEQERRATVRS